MFRRLMGAVPIEPPVSPPAPPRAQCKATESKSNRKKEQPNATDSRPDRAKATKSNRKPEHAQAIETYVGNKARERQHRTAPTHTQRACSTRPQASDCGWAGLQTANDDASTKKRRGCRTRRSRTGSRCRQNALCGGVTTPPLLSIALRLQTAREKSALAASVAYGRCGHDSRMHGARADPERKGADSRAQVGRGMVGWDGLGSAPHRKSLIFERPGEFQRVDQPQSPAASGLPLLVLER